LAAPLTATRVGAYWVDRVVRTETRGCWRSVFADYERCTPHGLLLGPRLRDIDAQDLEDGEDPVPDDAAWSSGDDSRYDGGDGSEWTLQPQNVTDMWMPAEIAERFGYRDDNWGLDYEPAEYLYDPDDWAAISSALAEAGIMVVKDAQIMETFLLHGPLPMRHQAKSWEHQVVDRYGCPAVNK